MGRSIEQILEKENPKSVLLVCGKSFHHQELYKRLLGAIEGVGASITEFMDFTPNPKYESVVEGVEVFLANRCDFIIAAGGGSAMDVAKCIKLFWNMDKKENYLKQKITENKVPILAIPTTAGTGSEATQFAVIYYEGTKQSVSHKSCIPDYVVLEPSLLESLPAYQKKVTMLDALCHAIESYWSVHATDTSKQYAVEAIQKILRHRKGYLQNTEEGNRGMLQAANVAGCAINLTQTTAGHAMCYKLTTLYGLSHGHAAALCVQVLWPYMVTHSEDCVDPRGTAYLQTMFQGLSEAMGCKHVEEAIAKYRDLLKELSLPSPVLKEEKELTILKTSVNPVRLKNNPVKLSEDAIEGLYREILHLV